MGMKDNQFDRIIREKLDKLSPEYRPETWSAFEHQLDIEHDGQSSANGNFDRIIGQKMEGVAPAFQPESWDWLEQRLDAEDGVGVPEPEAKVIDETVFNKLHRLEVSYNPNSWLKMAQLLDKEFIYSRQVLLYKATELLLMALLVWTLWPHLAITDNSLPAPAEQPVVVEPHAAPATLPDAFTPIAGTNLLSGKITPSHPKAFPVYFQEIWLEMPLPANSGHPPMPLVRPNVDQRLSPLTNLTAQLERKAENADALRSRLFLWPAVTAMEYPVEARILAALDPPRASSLAHSREDESISGLPTRRKNNFLNFGMFGSLDYNRIITPPDRFLDVEVSEFDRYELGYSGGFTLGFEFDRWEVQTGLIYTAKHYQPLQVLFLAGRFDEGYIQEILKDIELNIINVPLNFKYNLIQKDKWRLYALAGASVQVAVQANYYVSSQSTFRSSRPSRFEHDSFYDQGFEGGWLEGGSFRENSYITGNLGFGVERFITTQWSVFAQPTYQHAIGLFNQGLGPTMDRINTMSMYTGIRIRLRK